MIVGNIEVVLFDNLDREYRLATTDLHTYDSVCKVCICMRFHYKLAVNIPNSLNMHIFVSTNKQTDKHTERQSNHSPLAAHACTQGKGKKKLVTIAYCMIS